MLLYMHYPSWLKPEIFSIGNFAIRWYSLGYVLAFITAYILAKQVHKRNSFLTNDQQLFDMAASGIIGMLIGARLFYALFYEPAYFFANPIRIIWFFEGTSLSPLSLGKFVGIAGLSYHGGALGALLGVAYYVHKHQLSFWRSIDLWSAVIPFGYTFGRWGNFANAELYGRATASALGMVFPNAREFSTKLPWVRELASDVGMEITGSYINLPRHPSQLYEAIFEGVILGLILLFIVKPRVKVSGQVFACYLIGYGLARFLIEYLREPDAQLGYIFDWGAGLSDTGVFVSFLNISMGQILSMVMMLIGAFLYLWLAKKGSRTP